MLGFAGVTASDTSVAGVTANSVVPEMLPLDALIVVEPGPIAVASPIEPGALLTDATVGADEVHTATAVRSCVELSV